MAPPDLSKLSLYAATPAAIEVASADSQAEKGKKKKKKKVKLSQAEIDVIMATPPRRPFPRPSAEKIRAIEDPESLEIAAKLLELYDSAEAQMKAWDEEEESSRQQFLDKGEAFVEVTDDEAD